MKAQHATRLLHPGAFNLDAEGIVRSGLSCLPTLKHPLNVLCDRPAPADTMPAILSLNRRASGPCIRRPYSVICPHPNFYVGSTSAREPIGRQNGREYFAGKSLLFQLPHTHVPMTTCTTMPVMAVESGEHRYRPVKCIMQGRRLILLAPSGMCSGVPYDRSKFAE